MSREQTAAGTSADARQRIVVVGAGHAGGEAVAALRAVGFDGELILIGAEQEPPYQRPPLSKAFLTGNVTIAELAARPRSFYETHGVELRLGQRVEHVDTALKQIYVGGASLTYDILVLATGGRPRELSAAAHASNIHYVKTVADVVRLREALTEASRIGVIGGGFVGLEVAASTRTLGAHVTVLEAAPRPLGRTCSESLADYIKQLHRARGNEIRTGVVDLRFHLDPTRDRVSRIETDTGTIAVDEIVVGIGMTPETQLAAAAGLSVDDGILVDFDYRTSVPEVFAIGDCARVVEPGGTSLRLESAPHAAFSARRMAAAVTGRPTPDAGAPWFWSHQFDAKIQMAGDPRATAARWFIRGDPSRGSFVSFGTVGDRVIRIEAVNSPAEFIQAKSLLIASAEVDFEALVDEACPLRQALSRV